MKGVTFTGLDEFKQELELLTTNLVDEANAIMVEHAQAAKADIAAAYPVKKGGLRRGLVLREARGILLAGAELVQTAPHGYIFEHGTKPRYNRQGAYRGVMNPTPTFEPTAAAYLRAARSQIIYRLYAHGASRVTGDIEEEVA